MEYKYVVTIIGAAVTAINMTMQDPIDIYPDASTPISSLSMSANTSVMFDTILDNPIQLPAVSVWKTTETNLA